MRRQNVIHRVAQAGGHKVTGRRLDFYPVAFCLHENTAIGFGSTPLKVKADQYGIRIKKVNAEQWVTAEWLTPAHKIDFSKYIKGSVVLCPKCGGRIDFRAFMSSTKPEFKDVSKTSSNSFTQLPKA